MKKKQDRKDKLINEYKKDVEALMEKHDFHNFLTCLRLTKIAFLMSYHNRNKTFLKEFYKMNGKDTAKFVDDQIVPIISWSKAKV